MKKLLLMAIVLIGTNCFAQKPLISKNTNISFFSSTPVEDIQGINNTAISAIDVNTGEVLFKANNTAFQFKKKLMQEHFNENYMESEQYPVSSFNGKIMDKPDFNKDGTYTVTVSGTLNVHGVSKIYTTKATLIIKDKIVKASAAFKVKTADHKIKIPSLVITHIAEVMDIKVNATYQIN
ncbi:YceI family protein [Pedobacter punctiformis]|uniref:YceI family protein n=1 Tax=Pedobacter punctiformis TaxID=3004097 RepID=A0ABT4LF31_9SPHI|nr:YceI family protein [Pedobacter sp. HCMS5-2]MCZ4245444.1 YceI family protein [Pedobacter sp. HCMS5-2]